MGVGMEHTHMMLRGQLLPIPGVDIRPLELSMGHQAHLGHTLRAPKLVDELVQRVHWQLPAQRSHLGQQALFQPFYPFQDTRALQVSLKWVQGT